MPNINCCHFGGNLTRDPQLKYLPGSQTPVVEFSLAINRKFKGQNGEAREEVNFLDFVAYAKQAEVINQYCAKGKPLYVQARAKYDRWEHEGSTRSKIVFVVENFQFLGGRESTDGGNIPGERPTTTDRPAGTQTYPKKPSVGEWKGAKLPDRTPQPPPQKPWGDDDIPF